MAAEEIATRDVTYKGSASDLKAFIAEPSGGGQRSAVIVVQEWWGLNDHIRDVTKRFARLGYIGIAPDLYSRQGNKVATDPGVAAELMGGLKTEDGIDDLQSTVKWMRAQKQIASSRIGIIGFCMGGSYAMLLPCESKEISAAAPFYGEIPSDDKIKNLSAPIFYAYGENDGWIQRKDVDRLAADLKKFNKRGEVKVYEGCSHGFFNDTRPDVYNAAAAKDAWEHVTKLFATDLKA
jgi:carboxymethylenebutenolidase